MSYYVVKPPRRTRLAWIAVLGAVGFLLAVGLTAGWAAAQPVSVTVDGVVRYVPSGTTISDLAEAGALSSPSGRLLGVDGSVASTDGGAPPSVTRNGAPVELSQRVYSGDVVASGPGSDRRESLVVTDVPMPFKTRYKGSGPLTEMKELGSPGLRRVTRGAVTGVEVTSTVVLEPTDMVVVRTRPTGKVVALTFDDGPWPVHTEKVLKVLAKEDVKATFFMLGVQVRRHPKIARSVASQGHSVGSHSYSHKPFDQLSVAQLRHEIRYGRRIVERTTGETTNLLRPPYGAMDAQAWREVRYMKARAVMWDVDSRDWTKPGTAKMVDGVVRSVRPGSVVLFHDGGGDRQQTARALGPIIRRLKRQGYTFVTVDELFELRAEKARKAAEKKAAKKAAKKAVDRSRSGTEDGSS